MRPGVPLPWILLFLALLGGPIARGEVPEPVEDPGPPILVPPEVRHLPSVPYPPGVDAGGGQVVLEVTVGVDGTLEEVEVVEGVPPFLDPVLEAVEEARFTPATEDGVAVPVVVPLVFDFPEPPVNVAGVLRRRGDRAPLPRVPLRVADQATQTDEDGRFAFRNVPPGSWTIESPDPALRLTAPPVELEGDQRVDLELYALEEEWVYEALGFYTQGPHAHRRTLSAEEIATSPGALGDPVRALQNVPGVVRTPLDTGWLLVRGGRPDDTRVFVDGVEVPLLYHLGGFTSILHPRLVEAVDLWPGATPARLGRSLAGAAEIRTRRVGEEALGAAGVNLVWAHAYAEHPLGEEGGVAIGARRSYLDAVLTPVVGAEAAGIAPRFWDVAARVEGPDLGLTVIGMADTADAPLGEDNVAEIGQRAIQVRGRAELDTPLGRLTATPWLSAQDRRIDAPLRSETLTDLSPGLRAELQSTPWDGTALQVGVETARHQWRIDRDGDRRRGGWTVADPYGEVVLGEALQVRLGGRLTTLFVDGQLPRIGLSPRADLRWQIDDAFAVVAEASRTHQAPPPFFLVALPDGPYLHLERATGAAAGVRWAHRALSVDLDVFHRHSEDLAAFERNGSVGALEARAHGFEATGRVDLPRTRAQLIYQFTRSRFREEPGDAFGPLLFDQPHRINAMVAHRLPRAWQVGARWRYASGFPGTPGLAAYDLLTQQDVEVEIDDRGRLAPYHALDLRVGKRFALRSWHLEVYLDVQNVYTRRIPEPTINGIDETLLAYGFGLPFLPIFGVEGVFWP